MRGSNKAVSRERRKELYEFQRLLGIRFRNLKILNTALSHKSYVNESEGELENYEKLEFLGDSFLGLVVSDYLYNQDIYLKEGTLARIKSYVVSESTLYRIGMDINIQKYLLLGKGEEKSGGRFRKALIGDCIEALIGAYYLDAGFSRARKLVVRLFAEEIETVEENRHVKDYKSILQEYAQKRYKVIPHYTVINTEGPDHKRTFYVKVLLKKRVFGPGIGDSKKQAEQNAASLALSELLTHRRLRDPNIEWTGKKRHYGIRPAQEGENRSRPVSRQGDASKKSQDVSKKRQDVSKKSRDVSKKRQDASKKGQDATKKSQDASQKSRGPSKKRWTSPPRATQYAGADKPSGRSTKPDRTDRGIKPRKPAPRRRTSEGDENKRER
ncbi:MAG: ribonuclease III [Spirochaetes bacterium]|nr:ribonuclease III [Spirochaetota bacterium]